MVKAPFTLLAKPENVPEQLLALRAAHENVLAGGALLGESGRNGDALYPQCRHMIEKLGHLFG